MKQRKILVFGYFGYVTNQIDGQTIKTRSVYELLRENTNDNVVYSDTQEFRCSVKSVFHSIRDLMTCDILIVLPCLNNLKMLFPIIWCIMRIRRTKIIHVGIGGWHAKYISKWPLVKYLLGKISVNLLETEITAKYLESHFGYKNIRVFPNFRMRSTSHKLLDEKHNKLRLVFMARVNINKGLDTLASLCYLFHSRKIDNKLSLSIFGPCDSIQDKDYLEKEILDKYDFVEYLGVLEPDEIDHVLPNFDVFLFPTHYYTEGFPGSILDAYCSGLPVIATKWEHSQQFIINGETGFIVNFENPVDEIYNKIVNFLDNPLLLAEMKKSAFAESKKYSSDSAWGILSEYIS